jgi:hypothetical protein
MSGYLASIFAWPVESYYLIAGALQGGPGNPTPIQGLLPPFLGFAIAYTLFGSPLNPEASLEQHIAGYLATGIAQKLLVGVLATSQR